MKRLISYIWPITKYVKSDISGTLEVTWVNGEKRLDSKNANYSFGSLQRILKFGLSKIEINATAEILLLGLGAGSVVQTLRKENNFKGQITALEIDPVIIHLAEKEFSLANDQTIEIICADAISFVNSTEKIFSVIIIDLFIDNKVLEECYSTSFWKNLSQIIEVGGFVIFNAGLNKEEEVMFNSILKEFTTIFDFTKYEKIEKTNTLFIGKRI